MSSKFYPIEFREWFALNREDIEREFAEAGRVTKEVMSCDECDGYGLQECDLGHEHPCEKCDETGKVTLEIEQVIENYGFDIYNFRVKQDKRRWEDFNKEGWGDKEVIVTIDNEGPQCLSVMS